MGEDKVHQPSAHIIGQSHARPDDTSTVNYHLAHLSALLSWSTAQTPEGLLRHGDPPCRSPRSPRSPKRWPTPKYVPW
ncbi:hypothetical protein [Nonomuraea diastatica]|uniref:Uncharacterized protein n=1 Tax=Nonomuraea diastatica TaxID=1848329 RepID=A0A4R4X3H2_9ACTN|nr:hypothetical protein [Nonomuraea diastatica]TDD24782.1 hypothetical protein E1294_04955 [Nonomuraea diastatica]